MPLDPTAPENALVLELNRESEALRDGLRLLLEDSPDGLIHPVWCRNSMA
jgi:hypothetical protein